MSVMKITHVYRDSYPPQNGGIEQHIHTLVHQLKHQARPEVLSCGTARGALDDDGVPIVSVGALGRYQGAPISPDLPLQMRRSRADLFHFHSPNPTGELAYLLSGSRTPAVVSYHTDIVRQAKAFRYYRPFFHLFLRKAARIIVATPQHIDGSPILPAYREKCQVIPYGIDIERFRATSAIRERAAALREQYGHRLVLFVGKFRYYKGLEYLLRAVSRVEGRLLLVGDGEEKARLTQLAGELCLGDRVVWLPHLPHAELVAMLHACDVFVLPSCNRMEMFGLAQLEAQACGKPVVATALGTGVEYVNLHERTGLIVPPCDPVALGRAITRLLNDPDLRARLGAAAAERAHREFRQEEMAASTLRLYDEVLAETAALEVRVSGVGRRVSEGGWKDRRSTGTPSVPARHPTPDTQHPGGLRP